MTTKQQDSSKDKTGRNLSKKSKEYLEPIDTNMVLHAAIALKLTFDKVFSQQMMKKEPSCN